jgi:4-amino-4-deoxy-L-arabinose transferase-like glycosyltransferase
METGMNASARDAGSGRPFWISIAIFTVFAVALRVLYLKHFGVRIPPICDASGYYHMGRYMALGHGYLSWTDFLFKGGQSIPTAAYPPLYPALLALLRIVGIQDVASQRLTVAVLGALNVPLLALVGRRLAGPIAGCVAAALVALSPALIENDGSFMTEGLYTTLISLTLLAILHAEAHEGWRSWAIVGALLGLAALTRSEGILLLGLLAFPIAWLQGQGQRLAKRSFPILAAGLGLVLVVAPWTIRNAVQMGAFIPVSQSYKGVLVGSNCELAYESQSEIGGWVVPCVAAVDVKGLSEAETFEKFSAAGMKYALDHRQQWPRVIEARVLRTWGLFRPGKWFGLGPSEIRNFEFAKRTMWTGWLLIAIAPIGLALVARRSFVHFWMLLAPIIMVTLTSAIAYGNPRFRAAAEPSLILLAAIVCASLWQAIRSRVGPLDGSGN